MSVREDVLGYYRIWGYNRTIEYLRELSSSGRLVLKERAELQDMITELEMKPKRKSKI